MVHRTREPLETKDQKKKKKQRTHRTTGTIYNKDQRNSWHTGKEEQLTHIAIVRKPWSFKKYRVMASCFSTDNTSSPFGLLPGWRKGRNSSTTDMETARFILKFFFRSLSSKIPSNKLSHHCSVPPNFSTFYLDYEVILIRMCRSRATVALYFCVSRTVNCLWRKLCIIKGVNKKPQHWKVAARAPIETRTAQREGLRVFSPPPPPTFLQK